MLMVENLKNKILKYMSSLRINLYYHSFKTKCKKILLNLLGSENMGWLLDDIRGLFLILLGV